MPIEPAARPDALQQLDGMAGPADRAIDDDRSRPRLQHGEHFSEQDRPMLAGRRAAFPGLIAASPVSPLDTPTYLLYHNRLAFFLNWEALYKCTPGNDAHRAVARARQLPRERCRIMPLGLLGLKVGMTQVYDDAGKRRR